MKTATDETVTVLWTPGRSRRQDAARAQRAAEQKRQAKAQRKEQKRLEREQQAARERMEKRLRVSDTGGTVPGVGSWVLGLLFIVVGLLWFALDVEWLEWCAIAAIAGAVVCAFAWLFVNPDTDPPAPELLDLAMTLPPDAASALERVLDSGQEPWMLSSVRREQRRRALLVRAVHVLGDSAAPIVDDAIRQGLDPLTGLLEAAVNAPR